jgi:hypothetical protein
VVVVVLVVVPPVEAVVDDLAPVAVRLDHHLVPELWYMELSRVRDATLCPTGRCLRAAVRQGATVA